MTTDSAAAAAGETLLTVQGLVVGYRGRPLLPSASFAVRRGELWAIVGPNGSGKTTFLRSVLGLLPPLGGSVEMGAGGVSVGYVPQRSSLDPNLPARVIDVVRGGLETGWSFLNPTYRMRNRGAVDAALRDAHVTELARRQVSELSEGQKQRVLMARALAAQPALLILDEPTSAMDANAERSIFELLDSLRESRDLGVLLVSHHLGVVSEHATHLLMVDKDHGMLLAGSLAEVGAHTECVARYGQLFQRGAP